MEKFYFLACRRWLLLLFSVLCNNVIAQFPKVPVNAAASSVMVESALGNVKQVKSVQKLQPFDVPPDGKSGFDAMSGKPEVVEKRDAFSKHYRNADGTFTAVISSGEVNYRRNGQWHEINTAVISSSRLGFSLENTTNSLQSYFGKDATSGVISKTEKGEVTEFLNTKMYWEIRGEMVGSQSGFIGIPERRDTKVYYKNLFPRVDAEFIVSAGKRKLSYIIADKTALGEKPAEPDFLVFSEDITLPTGWTHRINAKGDVEILDASGALALIYAKPTVEENYGSEKAELKITTENPAGFTVVQTGNVLTFLVKVKAVWLFDEDTKYPVAVDPTVYPGNVMYSTGWATNSGGNNDDVIAGYWSDGYSIAGFMRFNLSTIPDNSVISSIQSNIYYYARTGGLGQRKVAITDITVDPLDLTKTYADIRNSVTQYISSDYFTWTGGQNGSHNFTNWYANNFANTGVAYVQDALSADYVTIAAYPYEANSWNADNYAWFKGYSDSTYKPQLIITYADASYACNPQSTTNPRYIKNVQFVGTLIPDTVNPYTGYSPNGYGNYTALPNQGKQIPGGVVNLSVTTDGINAFMKAWVDWNNDGKFDSTEKMYDTKNIFSPHSVFGFVVPAGTAPGMYTIRIRTTRESQYFGPCKTLSDGETEDYRFEVIADCSAKITAVNVNATDGHRCGKGSVTLTAASSGGTTYKWYTTRFGGNAISGATGATFSTPNLTATTTYYVTAVNGSCESVYRTPVVARIDPTPSISFTMSKPSVCGDSASLTVTSAGDKQEVTKLEEKFNAGLGLFKNVISGFSNIDANWTNRPSGFKPVRPPYYVVSPAISSGYNSGNFAAVVTDVRQTSNILNRLEQTNSVDASSLTSLKLDFDLYYEPMAVNNTSYSFLLLEASANNGANWSTINTFTTAQGNPGVWSNQTFSLPAIYQTNQLKIRFTIFSYGDVGWTGDIAAVDNIRLYGLQDLSPTMNWTSSSTALYNSDCATPYSGATSQVCIKPTPTELENISAFNLTATATLSNGCSATGTVNVQNNSKIWNQPGLTDWNAANWKPTSTVPDATKCVVIKTPVTLAAGADGLAKNLTIIPGGSLTINSGKALTITDFIKNEGTPADLLVNSDANLLQLNDTAVNTGAITVKRNANLKRLDYNYWASPVAGQTLKAFSPGTLNSRFYTYRESDDMFDVVTNPVTTLFGQNYDGTPAGAAMGYAIRAPNNFTTGYQIFPGTFTGLPNNGVQSVPLKFQSGAGNVGNGYNLVGNPYPSNLDFANLVTANSGKIAHLAYFWTNINHNPATQGSNYPNGGYVNNYATLNATAGTPATYVETPQNPNNGPLLESLTPNNYIKVGQGFIVKALASNQTLMLNNAARSINTTSNFFNKGTAADSTVVDRFWLQLTTPLGVVTTAAIGYLPNATNQFELDYDADLLGLGADALFTSLDTRRLAIQGRQYPLEISDVVALGMNHYSEGDYTLSVPVKEGIFAASQNIYLKDNLTGTYTNLSAENYTFSANEGLNEGRFQIVYEASPVLGTADSTRGDLIVFREGDHFVIRATLKNITSVEVFDTAGRLLQKNTSKGLQTVVQAESLPEGMYLLKIHQGEILHLKKVIK